MSPFAPASKMTIKVGVAGLRGALTIKLCVAPAGGRLTASVWTTSTTTANDVVANSRQEARIASEPSSRGVAGACKVLIANCHFRSPQYVLRKRSAAVKA
jgi:hypothetical protein